MTKIKVPKVIEQPLNINVIGITEEDIIKLSDENGKIKDIVDLKRIKLEKGASFIQLDDMREGLVVTVQSFKDSALDLANLSLSLFDNVKLKRNLKCERSYIQ